MKYLSIQEACNIFKLLQEKPRIRMLNLLLHHDWISGPEFDAILDFDQQYQHRHITFMKRYNLLEIEKRGVPAYYTIKSEYRKIIEYYMKSIQDKQLEEDLEKYKSSFTNNA